MVQICNKARKRFQRCNLKIKLLTWRQVKRGINRPHNFLIITAHQHTHVSNSCGNLQNYPNLQMTATDYVTLAEMISYYFSLL